MKPGLIILAGGKSSRMGTNKALLPVGGQTSMERILSSFRGRFVDPIVVTNEPHLYRHLEVTMVCDRFPGLGPLAGIEAGLSRSAADINLVVACDMPFANARLAEFLLQAAEGYEAVVPRWKGKLHPLFAVYRRSVVPLARACLESRKLRMIDLFEQIKVLYVEEGELIGTVDWEQALFNMNHPFEYEEALARSGDRPAMNESE